MKVGIVSTFPPQKCGVGEVAQRHHEFLEEETDFEAVKISPSPSADRKVDLKNKTLFRKIRKIVEEEGIDILHVHHEFSLYWRGGLNLALMNLDIPVFSSLHTPRDDMPFNWWSIRSRLTNQAQHRLIRQSEKVIVHTQKDKRKMSEIYENIVNIPLGYVLEDYEKPESLETILFFGFIRETKNLLELIESTEFHDKKIIVAGGARDERWEDYENKVKDAAEVNPQVESHVGWVTEEERDELFKRSDCVILPYNHLDSGSQALADSVSFGRPVITSREPIFREVVEQEEIGVTCEPEPKEIGNAIGTMEENLERFNSNLEDYREQNSWKSLIQKYQKLYEESKDR